MKRVFIIHGWEGYPEEGWFPWLKHELENRGFDVQVPAMPNTDEPKIEVWVPHLKKLVGKTDKDTYFVGHSIGCQAILRYLEQLPEGTKFASVVLIAPWMKLDENTIREEGTEAIEIVKPWVETQIDFRRIKKHLNKLVAIFSDNDPYVSLSQKGLFEKELDAKIIVEHNKGHFSGEDGIKELPSVLSAILSMKTEI